MPVLISRSIFFHAFQWKTPEGVNGVLNAATTGGWQAPQPDMFIAFSQRNFFHDFVRKAIHQSSITPVMYNFQKHINKPPTNKHPE